MGDLRDRWNHAKKGLERAHVDTGLFKLDLGSKLGAVDKAWSKFEDARGEHRRNDPIMVGLAGDLHAASRPAALAAVEYERTVRHLADHATERRQASACTAAAAQLLTVIAELGRAQQL